MAQTSDLLRLTLQGTGENDNIWGQVVNDQLELLEAAIAGQKRIALAANDYTLSTNDGAADEARAFALQLEGAPTENLNVIVPALTKVYLVNNQTVGDYAVTLRTQLGTGVAVPQGEARLLYCDGDNVRHAATAENARKVGGLLPGDVIPRNVDDTDDDGNYRPESLLSRSALDTRYVPASGVSAIGNFTTGDVKLTFKKAENGWVRMADNTLGPNGSGATARADDDTRALYTLLWNNVDNDWAVVSGGRGATAADDYTAGKVMRLPEVLGRALAVAGNGSGLSARALGEALGEETHRQTVDEMPSHRHGYHRYGSGGDGSGAENDDTGADVETESAGGGEPFNVMQPSTFMNVLIKL